MNTIKKKTQQALVKKLAKQKGMTLLEIIIVLGIIGVVSSGVVVLAQRAIDAQNMTKVTQDLNTVQLAMVQTYRGSQYPEYSATAGQDPASLLVALGRISDDEVKNPFTGEKYTLSDMDKSTAADRRAFAITVNGLSLNQCRALVTDNFESYPFIRTSSEATNDLGGTLIDAATDGVGSAEGGIIKSLDAATGSAFSTTNPTHVTALCGSDANITTYAVTFGNH